jgi:hypothetical protein
MIGTCAATEAVIATAQGDHHDAGVIDAHGREINRVVCIPVAESIQQSQHRDA